ncbi:MAG TPA: TolC family protein [Burkholderiaceae bacterium]
MRLVAALSPLLLLTACATRGPVQAPAAPPAPAHWSEIRADGASPAWAPLLDARLRELQAQALQANTDIAAAALGFKQAQLQAEQQGLRVRPSASLSSSANKPLQSQGGSIDIDGVRVPVGSNTQWSRSHGASVSVSYEADLWNRLAQAQVQQQALSEAARSDIDAARLLIVCRVAESFWTLATQAHFERIARAKLALAEQALPLVSLRVREGKLPPLEIDKAAANVQSARQALAQVEAATAKARLALAGLLDQAPPGPVLTDATLPTAALPAWLPDEPPQVLERRPDIRRARLEVDAALANARATHAARYPQLTFSAGLGTGGQRLSDWFSQPLLSLAAGLTVPLIDWRRLDIADAQARTSLESAALRLRASVNKALGEVQSQLIDAKQLEAQRLAIDERLQQAVESERLADLKLDVGSLALVDALQIRIARLDAEQAAQQQRLDALLNRLSLLRALAIAP